MSSVSKDIMSSVSKDIMRLVSNDIKSSVSNDNKSLVRNNIISLSVMTSRALAIEYIRFFFHSLSNQPRFSVSETILHIAMYTVVCYAPSGVVPTKQAKELGPAGELVRAVGLLGALQTQVS